MIYMADNLKVAGLRLKIEGAEKFISSISKVNSQLQQSTAHFNKMQAIYGSNSKSVELLAAKQQMLQEKLNSTKAIGEQYNRILDETIEKHGEDSKEAEKMRAVIARNEAEQAKLKAQLEAVSRQLEIQSSKWTQFGQKCEAAGAKMKAVGDKLTSIGKTMTTTVTVPLAAAGTAAGKAAIDFESAFAGVAKTVDATDEQLAELSDGIRDMAKEIPATTTEISAVAEAAGQLGIATEDVLDFTRVMIDLGNSTNLSAEEAASSLAKFANITGMAADDYDRLGSTIVALGNNFATTEADIVNMSTRLAGAGTTAGLTETDILALATAMSSVGIEAEAGGSAMSQTMNAIEKAVATGSDKVQEFARIAGMSADEFAQTWNDKPIDAITAFVKGLGQLDEQGESATLVLDELGLSGLRQSDMLKRLASASDLLTDAVGMSSRAWEENSALSEEAGKRYETMASRIQVAKNKLHDVGITIGNILMPYLEKGIDKTSQLAEKFSNLTEKQQAAIVKIGGIVAAIGPALVVVGKLVSSVGSIVTAVGKASKALGLLSTGFSGLGGLLSAFTGPVGIAVAALGLLAVAFATSGDGANEMEAALNRAEKSWGKLTKAKEEAFAKGEQEIADIQTLKLELDSIVDANGRVKEGYEERAAYIAGELSKATGTEISLVDGVIQSYDELGAAIDSYISKRRAEIALEAGADAYKAAIQGRKDLEQAYVDSYNAMLKAQEDYETASAGREQAEASQRLERATQLYQDLETQYNAYGEEIKTYEADLAAFRNGKYEEVASGLSGLLVSMEQFTAMSREQQEQQVADTEAAMNEKLALYQLTGDESTKIQADALAQQLADEQSYLAQRQQGRTTSDSEYISEQAGTNATVSDANSQLNADMTAQDESGFADRKSAQATFNSETEAAQATHISTQISGIRNSAGDARSATAEVTGAVGGELSALEGRTATWGANAIAGFVAGIRSMIREVRAAASETAANAELYIGFHSPAKKGPGRYIDKWGENAIKAWLGGMMRMQPMLEKTTATLSAAAMGGLNSVHTDNRSYSFGGVRVDKLMVRNDNDIKLIARELYRLEVAAARGRGITV